MLCLGALLALSGVHKIRKEYRMVGVQFLIALLLVKGQKEVTKSSAVHAFLCFLMLTQRVSSS